MATGTAAQTDAAKVPADLVFSQAQPSPTAADSIQCSLGHNRAYKSVVAGRARIWWDSANDPAYEAYAKQLSRELTSQIAPKLTQLLGQPLSDLGEKCHGIDGRLDITLVPQIPGAPNPSISGETERFVTPSGACTATPVFILLRPVESNVKNYSRLNRANLAHEFMHAVQTARNYAQPCDESLVWWLDATAEWAVDYVYPTDDVEHSSFEPQRITLTLPDFSTRYAAYTWPFFLAGKQKDPKLIVRIFNALRTSRSTLAAMSSVIPGGFARQFPIYATYYWNDGPATEFLLWDRIKEGASDLVWPTGSLQLSGQPRAVLPLALNPQPALSASYIRAVNIDSEIGIIRFKSPTNKTLAVEALLQQKDGQWRPVENWTNGAVIHQSHAASDVTEIILAVANTAVSGAPIAVDGELIGERETKVPSAPRNLTATRVDGGANLSWQPPADTHGLTIRGYTVHADCSSGTASWSSDWSVADSATMPYFLPYLSGAACTFQVRAETDPGAGEWSAQVPAENRVASPPRNLTATRVDGGANLSWQPPADTHGLTIRGYTVHADCSSGTASWSSDWSVADSATMPYFLPYLSGAACTFQVRAETDPGPASGVPRCRQRTGWRARRAT